MKTIHHVFEIAATPAKVWDAITTEDGLSSWWSTRVSAPDQNVGTLVKFTFRGDFNPIMKIEAVNPGKQLDWRCVDGHEKWADGTFRFQLEPADGGTKVRFWQQYAVELADDYYGTYNYNWGYYLQSLSDYCETGTGHPFVSAP